MQAQITMQLFKLDLLIFSVQQLVLQFTFLNLIIPLKAIRGNANQTVLIPPYHYTSEPLPDVHVLALKLLSYIIKAGKSPRFQPIEPGKYASKLEGQLPTIAGQTPSFCKALLYLVMFPAIARNITRPAKACITVQF